MFNNGFPRNLIEYIQRLKEKGVPEDKYQRYTGVYFEYVARERGIPLSGCFELTPLCNLNCKMCYVHLSSSQFRQEELINITTWKRLIDDAIEAGMRSASLTGGECLTYPGFDEIYLYLKSKGIRPGVLSNGLLLNESRIDFFKKHTLKNMQITVYGSCDDAYEKVTGVRAFTTVRRNVLMAKEAGLPITIAITPSRFMADDMEAILREVDSWGIRYFINAFLCPPRENTGRIKEDLTIDQYIQIYRIRDRLKNIEEQSSIDATELPDPAIEGKQRIGVTCGAGRSFFIIRYDGNMSPCMSMNYISSNPMEVGFKKAWKEINEMVNSYVLPEECGECVYYDVCLKCPTLHRFAPKKGHCDPLLCNRTKRMVAAGVLPIPKKIAERRKES